MENHSFEYTYSAQRQQEVEEIRKAYLPKEEDKMEKLRKLHSIPTQKAQSASIAVGVIGALILGTGMSLCMTELGAALGRLSMIIATAAFAFYKFISRFIDLAKDRKHTHPVDSSVRMLELSQAIFAIFSLQAGLLHTFGTGENWEHPLNLAVGCIVCLLTVAMGIYMIRRANREIQKLQEKENG